MELEDSLDASTSGNQQGVWLWSLVISTLWLWNLGSSSFFKQLKIAFLDFDFKAKVFDLPQALVGLFFKGQCLHIWQILLGLQTN